MLSIKMNEQQFSVAENTFIDKQVKGLIFSCSESQEVQILLSLPHPCNLSSSQLSVPFFSLY